MEQVNWLNNTNVYEVNIRQYTAEGTFSAFAAHLPRLKEMGIKILWFMPIQPIGFINRKGTLGSYYSIKNYTDINSEFGNLQDFKNIISFAHINDMKVIIDWVANHTSWDNDWVTNHPEYYAKNELGNMYSPNDWSDVVQLNHNNIDQQNAMIKAMEYWVKECDIDGFRCDMAHLTPIDFWKNARLQCDKLKTLFWLAETQEESYFEVFDAIYGWEWLHKMEDFYNEKCNINDLNFIIEQYYKDYKNNKFRILFTSNHDENSWQGTEYKRLGESAITFATLCATLPGIPLIYSGQEEPLLKELSFFDKDNIDFNNFSLKFFYNILLNLGLFKKLINNNEQATFSIITTSNAERIFAFSVLYKKFSFIIIANLNKNESEVNILDNKIFGIYNCYFSTNSLNSVSNENYNFTNKLVFGAWEAKLLIKLTND